MGDWAFHLLCVFAIATDCIEHWLCQPIGFLSLVAKKMCMSLLFHDVSHHVFFLLVSGRAIELSTFHILFVWLCCCEWTVDGAFHLVSTGADQNSPEGQSTHKCIEYARIEKSKNTWPLLWQSLLC